MADHSKKCHDGSNSRKVSNGSSNGIAAIANKLDSLGRDVKKLKENCVISVEGGGGNVRGGGGNDRSCGGNGGKGGSMAGRVSAGVREVKGGGVDFGVSKSLLSDNPRVVIEESGRDTFGVDGGAVW
ncbi:hypothetical protein Tco_0911519 [Tanacetum coccineum]|uniref:Uncharacterized protein n=1 Tax=Tanacetum coccineum TaxID=301880 RepID=A0ABQ5D2B0_9ASTR